MVYKHLGSDMDTSKYKTFLQNLGLVLAIAVFCMGLLFTGMVIGENTTRSSVEADCAEKIATKDQLIEYLTHTTIDSAADKAQKDAKQLKKLK